VKNQYTAVVNINGKPISILKDFLPNPDEPSETLAKDFFNITSSIETVSVAIGNKTEKLLEIQLTAKVFKSGKTGYAGKTQSGEISFRANIVKQRKMGEYGITVGLSFIENQNKGVPSWAGASSEN
jgi:hypothetical protein